MALDWKDFDALNGGQALIASDHNRLDLIFDYMRILKVTINSQSIIKLSDKVVYLNRIISILKEWEPKQLNVDAKIFVKDECDLEALMVMLQTKYSFPLLLFFK